MVELKKVDLRSLQLLVLAAVIGVATAFVSQIALVVGVGLFVVGLFQILNKRNSGGEAHLFSALIVGAEVYTRMSFVGLPWEFGKITVVILLLMGMSVERQRRPMPNLFLVYGILLFPAILIGDYANVAEMKKEVMFNLSGHVCLMVAVFYFFKRKMTIDELARMSRWMIYGILLMSALLLIKVPDYGVIKYGGGANYVASGGFGPNQVAAILGFGMFIMGYFLLINRRLFVFKLLDLGLLVLFTLQALFTLSRGGIFTAGLSLALGVTLLYLFNARDIKKHLNFNSLKIGSLIVMMLIVFNLADQVAGGAISKRFFNVDEYGRQIKEDYTTHRLDIIVADLDTFQNNLISGAGVGGGRGNRLVHTGVSAAHIEFSRMLAEHGILGLFALLIMLLYPIKVFFTLTGVQTRFTLVVFITVGLVTMSHNAMRLAIPEYFYGLGFVLIYLNSSRHTSLRHK